MLGEVIATDPPVHSERCPQCGYAEERSEPVETDWHSVRNQAAIAIIHAALSNQNLLEAIGLQGQKHGINSFENVFRFAISSARDLVERLKEEDNAYEQK